MAGSLLGEAHVQGGKDVTVAADQVVPDDLYASGEAVRIEGTVHGDLVAAAREIVITGTVDGDVLAAAQSITITGTRRRRPCSDRLRCPRGRPALSRPSPSA